MRRPPLEVVAVRVTRRGALVASTGALVYSATESSRSDPDAWYGRDAKVFELGRSAATSEIRIDDRLEAGQAVYAVRDIEAGRWGIRLTAERTT